MAPPPVLVRLLAPGAALVAFLVFFLCRVRSRVFLSFLFSVDTFLSSTHPHAAAASVAAAVGTNMMRFWHISVVLLVLGAVSVPAEM